MVYSDVRLWCLDAVVGRQAEHPIQSLKIQYPSAVILAPNYVDDVDVRLLPRVQGWI